MRIAFFGNLCNNPYQCDRSDSQILPEWDDPKLGGGYPPRIHFERYPEPLHKVAPWTSPPTRAFKRFDLLVVSNLGPMFTQIVKVFSLCTLCLCG